MRIVAILTGRCAICLSADRYVVFAPVFADYGLILVEGDSQTAAARIEVWRQAVTESPMAAADESVIALVTDNPIVIETPVWPRSNIAVLASRVLDVAEEGCG